MNSTNKSPRKYKTIPIENSVIITPEKYQSKPSGWLAETIDFTELSYYLGYKFEPRCVYEIWSPEGVARGGHFESRSRIMTVCSGYVYGVLVDARDNDVKNPVFEFFLGEGKDSLGWSVLIPEGVSFTFVPINGDALTNFVGDRPYNKFDNQTTLDIFDPALNLKKIPANTKLSAEEGDENMVSLNDIVEIK